MRAAAGDIWMFRSISPSSEIFPPWRLRVFALTSSDLCRKVGRGHPSYVSMGLARSTNNERSVLLDVLGIRDRRYGHDVKASRHAHWSLSESASSGRCRSRPADDSKNFRRLCS